MKIQNIYHISKSILTTIFIILIAIGTCSLDSPSALGFAIAIGLMIIPAILIFLLNKMQKVVDKIA